MLFIIKVTTNKEEKAMEMIEDRVVKKGLNVYAIARPHGLRGYIILEAAERESAEEAAFNLPYVKGIIGKTFKGEKAKVTRIDKQKGEVVVSLLGASVPIPVTVKIDNIKVIRREEREEEKHKKDETDESRDFAEDFE